jgi:hypothetical protein
MTPRQCTICQAMTGMLLVVAFTPYAQADAGKVSAGSELVGDPFLNYFALCLLFFVATVLFYGIIAIHDIPARIAHSRNHPHEDAIHAAGWVSLFTLHVLWPFLWIWAMAYQPERGWGMHSPASDPSDATLGSNREALEDLRARLAAIEGRLATNDSQAMDAPPIAPALEREGAS